ncbi:MAG: stage V sporulation protein D [Bacillota bacterium]|jgi:stage V sporulation protein D (sporulation-specific penicillin-binding protein)
MAPVKMKMRRKIAIVLVVILILLLAALGKLAYVQFVQGSDLQQKAEDLRTRDLSVAAKRGTIYDKTGSKLAISVTADSVAANPTEVRNSGNAEETATFLSEVLELEYEDVLKKITSKSSFVWVKRKADFEKAEKIEQADLKGISLVEETQRFYPQDLLASHVLGFAGIDNQGLEGIENSRNGELSGIAGNITGEYDAKNHQIPQGSSNYTPAQDGYDLTLTIDKNIQYFCERELDRLMAADGAPKRASILMMNPNTGEIIAMANRPAYDPNNYQSADTDVFRNMLVNEVYEPGSTFKIITASVALEEDVVNEQSSFYCPGYIKVGDATIKCWRSHNPHGSQSFAEIIQNSCNPGLAQLGINIENKEKGLFYKYIKAFGFGKKTDIELSGEESGIMIKQDDLKKVDIATISIGQSIAVTPIQMVTAVSAVANGGTLLKPQLVYQVKDKDDNIIKDFQREEVRQVISPETSKQVMELLESVVTEGTAKQAYIEGYRVGGKTGTAQKAGKGGYQAGKYIASFLGVAPVDDPQVVCLVILDEPSGYLYQGGQVAAPVFKTVMEDTLNYLGVVPQFSKDKEVSTSASTKQVSLPNFTNVKAEAALNALNLLGLEGRTEGSGDVVKSQSVAAFNKVKLGSEVVLYLGNAQKDAKIIVPDITNMRVGQAKQLLGYLGLQLSPNGSNGEACEQTPVPGKEVAEGTIIAATFTKSTETEKTEKDGP